MMAINSEFLISFSLIALIFKQCSTENGIIIMDQSPLNTKIIDLKTLFSSSKMIYHLLNSQKAHSYFTIKNDVLYTNTLIDMDTMCEKIEVCCNKEVDSCDFNVEVACRESLDSELIIKSIKITIRDRNDNYPTFLNRQMEIELSENLKSGHIIKLPTATDNDFNMNRVEMYAIGRHEPISFVQYFTLISSPTKAELKLISPLDREIVNKYSFELLAIDGAYQDRKTGTINIVIKVKDENDNIPYFAKTLYKETVKEGIINNLPILKLRAEDPDEGINGKIIYKFDPNNKNDAIIKDNFMINEEVGEIYLKRALDYEKQHIFKFCVIAINPTPLSIMSLATSSATVEISVENVFDESLEINIDYFRKENYSIVEENKNNVLIAYITVKSKEADQFRSSISCNLETYTEYLSLILKNDENHKKKTYEVRNIIEIDREILPKIETKIICKDSLDSNVPFSTAPLTVLIKDQNDNAPSLSISGDKFVKENSRPGTVVLTIRAVDKDEGENGRVSFSMEKSSHQTLEYLMIGETDGIIRVKTHIDCEANYGHLTTLPVIVTASDHGFGAKSSDLQFNIDIIDINDNPPKFSVNPMIFSVHENGPSHSKIGEIEVEDRDAKDEIIVEIVNHNLGSSFPFYIYKKDRRLFYLNTSRSLDREKESKYQFNIMAIDGRETRSHTITGSVEVEILDVNDNYPLIIFPPQSNASVHIISYKEPKNYKLMSVSANDQDQSKEFSAIEFQLEGMKDIFDIDRQDGYIFTLRDMTVQDIGEHHITVSVNNHGTPLMKSSVTITIVVDKSPPKSTNVNTDKFLTSDSTDNAANSVPSSTEILILVLIITIFLVVTIIIAFVVLTLRHFNKEPVCLRNMLNRCFRSENIEMENDGTFKGTMKNDLDCYKDQNQKQLIEKSTIPRDACDNWNATNNLVDNYNAANISNPYHKVGYTTLSNSTQYYIHSHAPPYQAIEDVQMFHKYPELIMNKPMLSLQNRRNYDTNYKSEMNLNTDNVFYEPNQELAQINEPNRMKWMSSFTPTPTRSKSVINRIIPNEQNENNFAVVYPQEQSTFV